MEIPNAYSVTQNLKVDVCIIGGSIAGNYLAYLLAKEKINCVVVEEHAELGKPFQCAGIISQKILKLMEFPPDIILNRVSIAEIVGPNLESIKMSGKESPIIIDRVKFDAFFGKKAQEMGVKYLLQEKYISHWALKKKNGNSSFNLAESRIVIQTNKRNIKAKIIVGADGPFSKVAKRFKIKNTVIPATQARIRINYPKNQTSLYFHSDYKELFGYIVPEGKDNICRIGIASLKRPNYNFKRFLGRIKKYNPIKNSSSRKTYHFIDRQGGVIPFGFPKHIAFQNTVLVGDSACMVKATTGGGIVMLVSAAKILSISIKKAILLDNYSKMFFINEYEKPIQKTIGRELKIHYLIRLLLLRLNSKEFNDLFKLVQDPDIQKIIQNYADMDFPLLFVKKLIFKKAFLKYSISLFIKHFKIIGQFIKEIYS